MHVIWFSMIRLKVDQKTDFFYQQIDYYYFMKSLFMILTVSLTRI